MESKGNSKKRPALGENRQVTINDNNKITRMRNNSNNNNNKNNNNKNDDINDGNVINSLEGINSDKNFGENKSINDASNGNKFTIDYSKRGTAKCRKCKKIIPKDILRIGKNAMFKEKHII